MKFKAITDAANEMICLMRNLCESESTLAEIERVADSITNCFEREGKVLICGNGGSGCDAEHFAEEFTGRFRRDRRALPVIALMDPAHITCVANDFGYHAIFSRSVAAFGKKGDVLIALSTSGNSANVKEAIVRANEIGMTTIGLLGRDGGNTKIWALYRQSGSDRLEKQPIDLRRHHHYMRDGALGLKNGSRRPIKTMS